MQIYINMGVVSLFFFNCLLGCLTANFGSLSGGQPLRKFENLMKGLRQYRGSS